MQALNSSSVQYAPGGPVPNDPSELRRYLENEFRNLQTAINALAAGHLDISYAAPAKPRDGDIRYADGTVFNPGSGKGVYYYDGSVWHLLG
ncbi:MAG: hypothetical protein ACXWAT_00075 [Methylobacter sp.]